MAYVAGQPKKKQDQNSTEALYEYLPDGISFVSQNVFGLRSIYFPLCGVDAQSLKSSITPRLSGDIKIDKNRYLTKPVSVEDLRQDLRNFFCYVHGREVVSLASGGASDADGATVEAGMLFHKLTRTHAGAGLEMEALSFVPISDENVELMRVTVRNISGEPLTITPTFHLPMFARALANKHDHEHVTSLLHRTEQLSSGVCVEPTMIFDERGHRPGEAVYYVLGADDKSQDPVGTFPTAESFYGEGGNAAVPEAVVNNIPPTVLPSGAIHGKEAAGALRFADETLAPDEARAYILIMGIASNREEMAAALSHFNSPEKFDAVLEKNKTYWAQKARVIEFSTGDTARDAWMRWVCLQPALRRIFGCSFLPDHDYGKGGKGWRDIWQDLLSLILIEPEHIRRILIDNLAGVRIDGSNATIIGSAPGEFVGDRNAIARVWMDHGVWPLVTLMLYINQTGDYDILLEENTYFCDGVRSRAMEKDYSWTPEGGHFLADRHDRVYSGSVVEHILVEHLTQFFNVGEHNIIRLEDADWNDGLDMARDRGESVAFTAFYGGNLLALADLLDGLAVARGIKVICLAVEIKALLDSLTGISIDYDDPRAKRKFLFETYFPSVQPSVSGAQEEVSVKKIAEDLRRKGNWIFDHIRTNEIVAVERDGRPDHWFNGYYDNKGKRLEGTEEDRVRMTLIGQVFPIMSGLAGAREIESVAAAVTAYLKDARFGGLRLNTDLGRPHYLDLGRAFGFAYGTKENGAFFNHMSVMYAYALYKRGFVREGYEALDAIYRMCAESGKSKIYPGIPEYFDAQGRGRYHYLTGSASWLVLLKLTEVFGVQGDKGDLRLAPKLVQEEFDPKTGSASVTSRFAGKKVIVTYENPRKLDFGAYKIAKVFLNGDPLDMVDGPADAVTIPRAAIEDTPLECTVKITLG